MGCELSHQIGLQLRQFLGQPSRNRLRSQLTRLPSLFQIAFEGGQRHAKQLHDLSSRAALVYRTHHSFPQIFRIRFHTSCSLSLLASRSFTYSITWLNSSASRCRRGPLRLIWHRPGTPQRHRQRRAEALEARGSSQNNMVDIVASSGSTSVLRSEGVQAK